MTSVWACQYIRGDDDTIEHEEYDGVGISANHYIPRLGLLCNLNHEVRQVSCGHKHTAIVLKNGALLTFGLNTHALGHGSVKSNFFTPRIVKKLRRIEIQHVSCGRDHTVAVDVRGNGWAWGWGEAGRLGIGDVGEQSFPKLILGLGNLVFTACGREHTIFVNKFGQAFASGAGFGGRLGLGDERDVHTPQLLSSSTSLIHEKITSAAAGELHSIVCTSNGTVYTFGHDEIGACGHGSAKKVHVWPEIVEFRLKCSDRPFTAKMLKVDAGGYHSVTLDEEGGVWIFGSSQDGQLGIEGISDDNVFSPVRLNIAGLKFVDVGAGFGTTAVVTEKKSVYCWGDPDAQDRGFAHPALKRPRKAHVHGTAVVLGGYGMVVLPLK